MEDRIRKWREESDLNCMFREVVNYTDAGKQAISCLMLALWDGLISHVLSS